MVTGKSRNFLLALSNIASLLFFFLIVYGAFTLLPTVHSQLSPACKFRMSYVYFALPFSFAITCIYAVHDIYNEIKSAGKDGDK